MKDNFSTERLLVSPLVIADTGFILEILNSEGFITFIGDRNVHTAVEAGRYIDKIRNDPAIRYWVVKLKDGGAPVGMVSLIKRGYLDHHDIGFAFLPQHGGKGYAFEAADVVLQQLLSDPSYPAILATVLNENERSKKLLGKLGLRQDGVIAVEEKELLLYRIDQDN